MTAVTEKELEAVSVAKRVTLADLEKRILVTHYFNAAQAINSAEGLNIEANSSLGRTTFAMLVLDNGFTVTGQSACASPQNFDAEIGKRIAREDAVSKLWALLGFELRTKLSLVEGAPPLCGWMETVGAKTYVGMKCLRATPMSRGDYNDLRGWILPENEDEHEAGYLVEYTDGGEQNVDGFAGYVSWSPAHVFEASYEQMD